MNQLYEINVGQKIFVDYRNKKDAIRYLYQNYRIQRNEYVWFAWIDGKLRKGWKNSYSCGSDTIMENNVNDIYYPIGITRPYRYVFEIMDLYDDEYEIVYKGKYALQADSSNTLRVLMAIDTVTPIKAKSSNLVNSPLKTDGADKIPKDVREKSTHPFLGIH